MKNLKFHLRTRHNFSDYSGIENWKRTFKCNTCDESFPDETNLKEHIENEHENNMNTLEEDSSIGKKHALKKYDQFALNTSCFWRSCAISRNFCYKNNE